MDIEQLSKSQIILLTLLVSFVTSIATGIVTVSLMGQAPPSIAQSVNRIVERTVEKVIPAGQTASTVITREKTVVVKESDLISEAVERSIRLYPDQWAWMHDRWETKGRKEYAVLPGEEKPWARRFLNTRIA